jgi:hypothetical protein
MLVRHTVVSVFTKIDVKVLLVERQTRMGSVA